MYLKANRRYTNHFFGELTYKIISKKNSLLDRRSLVNSLRMSFMENVVNTKQLKFGNFTKNYVF